MDQWDKWMKKVRNNRVVSIIVAGAVLWLLVCSSSLWSDGEERGHNQVLQIDFSFSQDTHGVGRLAPSFSPLQNTSDKVNHGAEESGARRGNNADASHDSEDSSHSHESKNISLVAPEIDERTDAKASTAKENENSPVHCDIYSGNWVRDDSYPLYHAGKCHYMSQDFDCKGNGRQDSGFTNWRWQPRDCNLPRLNATEMLERLRGKRIMFIGDSINRNQWESLLCVLSNVVPDDRKYWGSRGPATAYIAQDYNVSVEFYWAPFLVEQANIEFQNQTRGILRLDAIEKHGANWKDIDILVFNSGHWWTHGNKAATENFFQEGNYLHPRLDPMVAFEKALTAWGNWIDQNVNATKTRVFFRGFSPMHFSAQQWNKTHTHKCNFEREPILEESFVSTYPDRMQTVEKVLGRMKFPVSLLNITRLSDFRKDAHPSVYTLRGKHKLTREQLNDPDRYGDCSHWCLPGLPDIWNELLYGSLVLDGVTATPVQRSR